MSPKIKIYFKNAMTAYHCRWSVPLAGHGCGLCHLCLPLSDGTPSYL